MCIRGTNLCELKDSSKDKEENKLKRKKRKKENGKPVRFYYSFWISNASNNEATASGIRRSALYRNSTQITGSNFSNLDPGSGDPLLNAITISGSGLFTANLNDVIQLRNTSTVQILLSGAANSTQSNISLTLFRIADAVD